MSETYVCAQCGGVFVKGWTDAEAAAEYAVNIPDGPVDPEEQAIVCDDCYARIMRWARTKGLVP